MLPVVEAHAAGYAAGADGEGDAAAVADGGPEGEADGEAVWDNAADSDWLAGGLGDAVTVDEGGALTDAVDVDEAVADGAGLWDAAGEADGDRDTEAVHERDGELEGVADGDNNPYKLIAGSAVPTAKAEAPGRYCTW